MAVNNVGPSQGDNFQVQIRDQIVQQQQAKVDLNTPQDSVELSTKNDKKKKAGIIAGVIAGAAALVGAGFAIYKGKGKKLLSDIEFDKGVAKLKDGGSNFTGKISDTLKNGDKITLEYKDGVLTKSTRADKDGKEILAKVYKKAENGDKIVEITKDGKMTSKNTTEMAKKAKVDADAKTKGAEGTDGTGGTEGADAKAKGAKGTEPKTEEGTGGTEGAKPETKGTEDADGTGGTEGAKPETKGAEN